MTSVLSWILKGKTRRGQKKSLKTEAGLSQEVVERAWKGRCERHAAQCGGNVQDVKLERIEDIVELIEECELTEPLMKMRIALCGQDEETGSVPMDVLRQSDDVRHEMMSALATMVLKMFDRDGDGKLDFQEFIIGISCLSNGARSDRAKLQFRVMDLDSNGRISRDEAIQMVSTIVGSFKIAASFEMKKRLVESGLDEDAVDDIVSAIEECWDERSQQHSNVYADLLLRLADSDHDGEVSLEEYIQWQCNESAMAEFVALLSDKLAPVEERFAIELSDCIQATFADM